jgi:hypothetical protein
MILALFSGLKLKLVIINYLMVPDTKGPCNAFKSAITLRAIHY